MPCTEPAPSGTRGAPRGGFAKTQVGAGWNRVNYAIRPSFTSGRPPGPVIVQFDRLDFEFFLDQLFDVRHQASVIAGDQCDRQS